MSRRIYLLPCFLFVSLGCGGAKYYPVEGTVTFTDGTPMKGGTVEFRSDDEDTKGWNANGVIDKDGKFTLQTYRNDKQNPGAVPGKHSIIVRPTEDEGSMAGATPPVPIHADMLSYEKSGLKFEVKPGTNTCPLTVRKP